MAYKILDQDGEPIVKNDENLIGMDIIRAIKGVDMDKRTLHMLASDQTEDRDGDIIEVRGWDFEDYIKNPVMLWAHNYSSVPLAAAQKIMRKRGPWRLELIHRFPTEGINPFADMILNLYYEKVINAGSVGFIPLKWERMDRSEPVEGERYFYNPTRFIKQELLEHSGCAVPANPSAVQLAVKNLKGCDSIKELTLKAICDQTPYPYEEKQIDLILTELKEYEMDFSLEEDTDTQVQVPEDITITVTDEDMTATVSAGSTNDEDIVPDEPEKTPSELAREALLDLTEEDLVRVLTPFQELFKDLEEEIEPDAADQIDQDVSAEEEATSEVLETILDQEEIAEEVAEKMSSKITPIDSKVRAEKVNKLVPLIKKLSGAIQQLTKE